MTTTTSTKPERKVICTECRHENEAERIYCHNCGERIERSGVLSKEKGNDPGEERPRLQKMMEGPGKLRQNFIALSKVAARELARNRITVNAVAPGFINSAMSQGMPEEVTRQFVAQIPLGRFGEIEEVVYAVTFLCSEAARYITGQVIHVNGGFYMG